MYVFGTDDGYEYWNILYVRFCTNLVYLECLSFSYGHMIVRRIFVRVSFGARLQW